MNPDLPAVEGYESMVRSTRLLFEGEDTCLAVRGQSVLMGALPDSQMIAESAAIDELATLWVDRLVTLRLLANNQSVPIIGENDVEVVFTMIHNARALNLIDETQLRKAINGTLQCFLIGLVVVGRSDGYEGFAQSAVAITKVALEQGVNPFVVLDPEQAPEATGFRTAVFRRCMDPGTWQIFSDARTNMLEDSINRGNMTDAEYATRAEARVRLALISREYFAVRKREIWPNDNG